MRRAAVIPWGEITAFDSRVSVWTLVSITQGLSLLTFFVFTIFFILETQHVRFIALWPFAISWWIVGGILILLGQTVGFLVFVRSNRIPSSDRGGAGFVGSIPSSGLNYMGQSHVKELFLGWSVSVVSYLLIGWFLSTWLVRFGGSCCGNGPENQPDTSDPVSWRVFHSSFVLSAAVGIVAIIALWRTAYVHLNPLRTVTNLVSREEKK